MYKRRSIIFCSLLPIFLILNLLVVDAIGVELVCLRDGEKIRFSKCNPNMDDFVCEKTLCQLCVEESGGIYCPKNINSCNDASQDTCTFIYDDIETEQEQPGGDLPVITLLSPANEHKEQKAGGIDFSFHATHSYTLDKCYLILNENVVAEKNAPIQSKTNIINYSVDAGSYDWKIKCTEREQYGGRIIVSSSRTLYVGDVEETGEGGENNNNETGQNETAQESDIALLNPENGWSATGTQDVSFNYEISQDVNLTDVRECSLVLNDVVVATSNNLTSHANTFLYLVSQSSYDWKVTCLAAENLTSETRSLIINSPTSAPVGGGGGGGGGGGSSYRTYVATTEQSSEGYTKELKEKEKINFYINNGEEQEQHTVTVGNISDSSATLTIQSEPITVVLSIGQTKKFDLTADGYYDLLIKLNKIETQKANLTIQTINENIPEEEIGENIGSVGTEENTETGNIKSNIGLTGAAIGIFNRSRVPIVIAFIIVVVFAVVIVNYYRKKEN